MSAKSRCMCMVITFQLHHSPVHLNSLPKRRLHSSINSFNFINLNERRRVTVGLSKLIKLRHGYLLEVFSYKFCPNLLVRIVNLLGTRETAFAFFRFAFRDDSEDAIRYSCTVAHILAARNLRYLAQDVISWVISRIGETRSEDLVKFMWEGRHKYESDFSVLDKLMRAFLIAGMGSRALGILSRMREVDAVPSSSAMTILFEFLLRVGDYGSVWKLFRDMIREGPCPSNYTFNAMILGFCRNGHLGTAQSLLNVMGKYKCDPDVCSYNILINANCISGWTLNALNWVQLMIERGCKRSIFTFNIIVNALCSEGNLVEARKVVNEIQDIGLSPNVAIYNTLINGYVKARDVGHFKYGRKEDGDRLLRELLVPDLLPDHSLCDISVAGLCWGGLVDEAMKFLENMLERGMKPSIVAFNSIIAAYSRAGLVEDAYEVFKFMMKFSLTPSSSTCGSLLMGLSRNGRLPEAREILYKMMHKGFPINRVAEEGRFSRVSRMKSAFDAFMDIHRAGLVPDIVYDTLISGYGEAFSMVKVDRFMNCINLAELFAALGTKCVELKAPGERRHKEQTGWLASCIFLCRGVNESSLKE
ncbi:putative receptor-like protein kinase [Hibiscus syriacus]|uniref:Receptor-like protein kinase n=1 Tax=Hibiscus syriacus TaxID=106335 RepID=A0A6A3BBU4_HIBSY|nr:putative receptor-like protein kinase [Hibiscus syriacus]